MGRKSLWKTIPVTDGNMFGHLSSYYQSSSRALPGTVVFRSGIGEIETNMAYSNLRDWFHFAGYKLPDHVTDTRPSWEIDWDDD